MGRVSGCNFFADHTDKINFYNLQLIDNYFTHLILKLAIKV